MEELINGRNEETDRGHDQREPFWVLADKHYIGQVMVNLIINSIRYDKERIQAFEGTVIAKKHGGIAETFTVRRTSYGVGVERVFPMNSPFVEKVEVVRRGKVRRAKLFYLRSRTGKAAKVKARI